jgi:hypothetical protein
MAVGGQTPAVDVTWVLAIGAACAGAELLFRGLMHGMLVAYYPVTGVALRFRVSFPAVLCAAGSAAIGWLVFCPLEWAGWRGAAVWLAAGVALAIVTGVARERWHSVWVAVVLHAGVAAAVVAVPW